jgi:hypothetical protein
MMCAFYTWALAVQGHIFWLFNVQTQSIPCAAFQQWGWLSHACFVWSMMRWELRKAAILGRGRIQTNTWTNPGVIWECHTERNVLVWSHNLWLYQFLNATIRTETDYVMYSLGYFTNMYLVSWGYPIIDSCHAEILGIIII